MFFRLGEMWHDLRLGLIPFFNLKTMLSVKLYSNIPDTSRCVHPHGLITPVQLQKASPSFVNIYSITLMTTNLAG